MLESVANLKKKAKKASTAENTAFQQLFLLVGMHLFKVCMLLLSSHYKCVLLVTRQISWCLLKAPEELLDIMKDLQSCVDKAQEKKAKKKKKQSEMKFMINTK